MAKLTRGRYIVYIDASFGGEQPLWFKIGKSLSSLSVELNPDVASDKNIWDEVYATDNGYTPQTSVDPYHANPDDAIYEKIRDIAMNRLTGDACKTKIMEVIVEDEEAEAHSAWTEDILVKPTSTGGDTAGFSIPFDVYFDGGRKEGTVSYADGSYKNGTPAFMPKAGA
jgi:hypothetical protein